MKKLQNKGFTFIKLIFLHFKYKNIYYKKSGSKLSRSSFIHIRKKIFLHTYIEVVFLINLIPSTENFSHILNHSSSNCIIDVFNDILIRRPRSIQRNYPTVLIKKQKTWDSCNAIIITQSRI